MAVVKADGYGHGMISVAMAAMEAGAAYLGVATVDEGAALRAAGVNAPVALLCHPAPDEAEALLAYGLTATVGDWRTLDTLIGAARRTGQKGAIHLEIDTGIGRSGIAPEEAAALWRHANANDMRVTGLCAHFADADGIDDRKFTKPQIIRFSQTLQALQKEGARFVWIHQNASAGFLRVPGASGNLIRPGLLIYGLLPSVPLSKRVETLLLRPALTLKARIATVRELPAGHNVSYGLTHTTTRPTRAATILIGYGDGYPRRLSNVGSVLLHGKLAPILGRVCMDQTVVDVTDIPEAAPGDIAVCIGKQGNSEITAESLAALIETTVHEITTGLSARLPRITMNDK